VRWSRGGCHDCLPRGLSDTSPAQTKETAFHIEGEADGGPVHLSAGAQLTSSPLVLKAPRGPQTDGWQKPHQQSFKNID